MSDGTTNMNAISIYGGKTIIQSRINGQEITIKGGTLKLENIIFSQTIDALYIYGGILDFTSIISAMTITLAQFLSATGDYQIKTRAAGIFVPTTAELVTGASIDWRFEKAA